MSQKIIVSGWGMASAYAPDFPALIAGLQTQRSIGCQPWFAADHEWQDLRMSCNPFVGIEQRPAGSPFQRLQTVITQALAAAGLSPSQLGGKRVRVYLIGNGMRANIADFLGYQERNDGEELLFFPAIKKLHADSYAQERLMRQLVEHYQLSWPPISIYCASNSAIAAVHLAQAAIAADEADVALLVGWLEMLTQDVLFMGGQGMLGNGESQPFSNHNSSVVPANGSVALIMESVQHAQRRGFTPTITLRSSVFCQSSGARGSSSFTADFRTIAQTLERALLQAGITSQEIACVLPHGNGITVSDKAEAMALQKIWGKEGVPVVSYKGQVGYMITCSGLLDLMIAADALQQRRLLAVTNRYPIDESLQIQIHANRPPLALEQRHIIKSGLGLDGSAAALVISDYQEDRDAS